MFFTNEAWGKYVQSSICPALTAISNTLQIIVTDKKILASKKIYLVLYYLGLTNPSWLYILFS